MTILALIILALGLSMDSFAVSLSSGVALKPFKFAHVVKIALYLAFFQAVMPILGWLLGVGFVNIIQSVDHWIAFALLLFLGGKMIYDYFAGEEETLCKDITFKELFVLGIATSIDALAAGFCFGANDFFETIISCVIIGVITLMICWFGYVLGTRLAEKIGNKSTLFGGIILVLLGVKILIESII